MNFDLKIENYNTNELREMFELPENYNKNMTDTNGNKLIDNIKNNKNINENTREKTIDFLNKAKNILIKDMNVDSNLIQHKVENIKERVQKVSSTLTDFYNTNYDLKTTELLNPEQHMVQVDANTPFNLSFPSPYFPGIINPLKRRTRVENLIIDTRFRENYYNSSPTNFNLQLPMVIENVFTMQLSAIELPTTYYVISKQYGNNFFTINVNELGNEVISIPDGNYDQDTIINAINSQLSLLPAPYNQVLFDINLTSNTTGSAQTMVGFISLTGITNLTLDFQSDKFGVSDSDTPLPLKFGWILGFRNGIYVNNLNYVSEGVLDITGPKYLFLVVDDYQNNVNNNFYSAFNSSILNKNILARISLLGKPFDILQQNNLSVITTPREYFGPVDINSLTIQLLDEYGRIVDLNNMDFSFCITLITRYDI
jgi:hypothetical protein